jgi:hypothetical protein
MKKLAWAVTLGAALTGSVANADTIDEAVGNTVVVRLADGSVERYLFDADNTFTVNLADGQVSGTWALNGEKICIDIGDGEPICEDYPKGKKVGDTWTEIDDDDGSTLTISIEPGR